MKEEEIAALANAWMLFAKAPENSDEHERHFWAYERLDDLIRESPVDAWKVILEIHNRDRSTEITEVLSAGPLEDLLVYNGKAMIETIEHQAKADPSFAYLLGGVWRNDIEEPVWYRVLAVRDRRGWDGIERPNKAL
jgi:hypothetical protein